MKYTCWMAGVIFGYLVIGQTLPETGFLVSFQNNSLFSEFTLRNECRAAPFLSSRLPDGQMTDGPSERPKFKADKLSKLNTFTLTGNSRPPKSLYPSEIRRTLLPGPGRTFGRPRTGKQVCPCSVEKAGYKPQAIPCRQQHSGHNLHSQPFLLCCILRVGFVMSP